MERKRRTDTLIWRLEDKDGRGPYQIYTGENLFGSQDNVGTEAVFMCRMKFPTYGISGIDPQYGSRIIRNPSPSEDPLMGEKWRKKQDFFLWKFGFMSLCQYLRWFPCKVARQFLSSEGLLLRLYRVPASQVLRGETQAAFVSSPLPVILIEERLPHEV